LLQELTWWPVNTSSTSQHQSVERIVFSFYSGDLYKISVSYDSRAIQGLTAQDMVQTMSAMYGIPPSPTTESKPANGDRFDPKQQIIASWADPLSTSNLVRTSSDEFGLIVFSNARSAQAETADAQAVALDAQERPQMEAAQLKQQDADLETARQKNKKSFQP
jgi:hypothetical protein